MDNLSGRIALVTGGARRIGAAIVRELHARGMTPAVHYGRSRADAEALTAELNALRPGSAMTFSADLADPRAPDALIAAVNGRLGGLDLLVNSAAVFPRMPLAELTAEAWNAMLDVNLTAPLFLARAAVPLLGERGGAIVNIGDAYATRLPAGYAAYAATKAALVDLTRSLARELGPKVRVNAVAPGAVLWPQPEPDDTAKRKLLDRIPLARLGTPGDIARAVAFLAAEPYLTGVVLPVDGGRSLG